jgi:hypothetical protein
LCYEIELGNDRDTNSILYLGQGKKYTDVVRENWIEEKKGDLGRMGWNKWMFGSFEGELRGLWFEA